MPAKNSTDPCREAIFALSLGNLSNWNGLTDDCKRSTIAQWLPPVTSPVNASNPYSGPIRYAPNEGTPYGMTIHYAEDKIDYISIVQPKVESDILTTFGPPDLKLESKIEGCKSQWVYAGRGLVFHIDQTELIINQLYAFLPTTPENFKMGTLSQIETIRHRN